MRLGLNQPYFFPYIGHFSLIKQVDIYFVLDTVQYISGGWMNRNRILKPNGGWQYFGIPTQKHHYTDCLKNVKINNDVDWRSRIFKQLEHYKKAPYYKTTIDFLHNIFERPYDTVCELNVVSTTQVCDLLEITTPIYVLSESGLEFPLPASADEWGLNVCKAVRGVTEYWNAPGGAEFYNRKKYQEADIEIKFQKMILEEYPQKKGPFEPGLSIIDLMMFNSVEQIQEMMDHYTLV